MLLFAQNTVGYGAMRCNMILKYFDFKDSHMCSFMYVLNVHTFVYDV